MRGLERPDIIRAMRGLERPDIIPDIIYVRYMYICAIYVRDICALLSSWPSASLGHPRISNAQRQGLRPRIIYVGIYVGFSRFVRAQHDRGVKRRLPGGRCAAWQAGVSCESLPGSFAQGVPKCGKILQSLPSLAPLSLSAPFRGPRQRPRLQPEPACRLWCKAIRRSRPSAAGAVLTAAAASGGEVGIAGGAPASGSAAGKRVSCVIGPG